MYLLFFYFLSIVYSPRNIVATNMSILQRKFVFKKEKSSYELYAQPLPSGFFGLRQLQEFTHNIVEPCSQSEIEETLVFDFSLVKFWDVSVLLWLVVALHHYKQSGLSFLLRLPEVKPGINQSEVMAFQRSADYLRRWKFDDALSNLSPEPSRLLVPEQEDYFSHDEPLRYYSDRKETMDSGLLESLISRRLLHIRNLADPKVFGSGSISNQRITEVISDFQSARMGDILHAQCGINKRDADLFSEHLLTEALLNIREHPDATIGMIAISLLGNAKSLVLCVVDNGRSIPETIFNTYIKNKASTESIGNAMNEKYNTETFSLSQRAEIANYATQEGVTCKTGIDASGAGMGLHYIKNDTIETFKGKLRIITDRLGLSYQGENDSLPQEEDWEHSWKGNLLRITIPIKPFRE